MKTAVVQSRCECQAALYADLDDEHHVRSGRARDWRNGTELAAPAHSVRSPRGGFDVAWLCPFCARNTLRSFEASVLRWRTESP